MSNAERRLAEDRANRVAARQLVDGGVALVKANLAARGIGGRIKDKVVGDVEDTLATGVEIARENKPVVAGTIGLLLIWFLRGPLGRLASRMTGRPSQPVQGSGASAGPDEE